MQRRDRDNQSPGSLFQYRAKERLGSQEPGSFACRFAFACCPRNRARTKRCPRPCAAAKGQRSNGAASPQRNGASPTRGACQSRCASSRAADACACDQPPWRALPANFSSISASESGCWAPPRRCGWRSSMLPPSAQRGADMSGIGRRVGIGRVDPVADLAGQARARSASCNLGIGEGLKPQGRRAPSRRRCSRAPRTWPA